VKQIQRIRLYEDLLTFRVGVGRFKVTSVNHTMGVSKTYFFMREQTDI